MCMVDLSMHLTLPAIKTSLQDTRRVLSSAQFLQHIQQRTYVQKLPGPNGMGTSKDVLALESGMSDGSGRDG